MAETTKFWTKPRSGPKPQQQTTGSPRSYIPVISFGSPEFKPAGGLVGRTTQLDGTQRVTFATGVGGTKSASTRKPGDTK